MPEKKKILYITTNYCWGASEFLWMESIKELQKHVNVFAAVIKYQHPEILNLSQLIGSESIFNTKRFKPLRFYKRWLNKICPFFAETDDLKEAITHFKPDLVVISKGNAFGDEEIPLLIEKLGYRYLILNHLVTEINWPSLNSTNREHLIAGIKQACKNYFVSKTNNELLEKMLGENIPNSEVVYNPLNLVENSSIAYPENKEPYSMAVVGRLECLHKGIDILIDVIKQEKWRNRPITFNLYGQGPHQEIIESWIKQYQLSNIFLHGYIVDKNEIWRNNHILLLPSRMEGQSISLSEALYYRRTVIGTNVGGITELIDDNQTGFIAQYPNPEHLDEAMERAWNRRDEWKTLGELAHKKWRSITPDNPIEYFNNQLLKLINE